MKMLDSITKNIRSIVAVFIIFGGFSILFVMIFGKCNSEQKDLLYSIAGVVGTLLSLIVSYYFGASKTETKHESSTQVEDNKPPSDWENIN
jgi:succinate-acetate transporter protein